MLAHNLIPTIAFPDPVLITVTNMPGRYGTHRKRHSEGESVDGKKVAKGSSNKRQKTTSANKKKNSAAVFLVTAEEYGNYRETEQTEIGLYSTKELALENAILAGLLQRENSPSLTFSRSQRTTPRSLTMKVSSTTCVIRKEMDRSLP